MTTPYVKFESWSLTGISSSRMPKYLFHLTYFYLLDFIDKYKLYAILVGLLFLSGYKTYTLQKLLFLTTFTTIFYLLCFP